MNVIYPYCKGALFDNIKVQTLVVYATIVYATTKVFVVGSFRYPPKTCQKPQQKPAKNLAKNPLKIPHAKIHGKNL
jgi:hypothetical protein